MRIMPERRPAATEATKGTVATEAAPAAGTRVVHRPGGPAVRIGGPAVRIGGDAAPAGGAS
ncbi:hypothetical protein [Streptosporangium sandarakinum]|uniref:hypothetical protein n=1 Tax=Streptosporangium sandarakinum TaxID=1260955 RepID=UPI0034125244